MVTIPDRKATILIVEDSLESVDLLVYFLNPAGYDVKTVSDGVAAIEFVKRTPPDLILLDIMLPKLDGYQVCENLKKDDMTFHIPIIMITALKELKDKIKALEAGADDFISKPFDNVELLTRVKSLLRIKFYHDELLKRNSQLEEQKNTLEREDLLKKELTNLIVHDMKNPLFIIQGNLQMMSLNKEAEPNKQQKVYTQRIARSSRSLLRMILNLLDISRLEQKTMDLEPVPCNINHLISDIIDSYKDYPEHQTKSIHIKVSSELSEIYVDRDVFDRVLDNVIIYILKNTGDYKSVVLETAELPDKKIILKITNDGRAIPEAYRKKIFLKKAQPELKKAGYKPARGLSLIFCKLAMNELGGDIYVTSDDPENNTFSMEIPTLKFFQQKKS